MTTSRDTPCRTLSALEASDAVRGFTDVHCHCLPGLDDGPADLPQALSLCRALVADGVTQAVASPHQLGRFDRRVCASAVREAAAQLNRVLRDSAIALQVLVGADVRLDERIPQLLEADAILTVADGHRYLLLELPHEVFIDPASLLRRLGEMGLTAVITHPERHDFLIRHRDYVQRWQEYRPCLQLTAASFTGDFGPSCEQAAWGLLVAGLPVVVATDAHDTNARAPRLQAAYHRLSRRLGRSAAQLWCVENPRRLVAGQELLVGSRTLVPEERR